MKPHTPQLRLRLDAVPPTTGAHWCAGTAIPCCGRHLTLVLDTACPVPERRDDELHLPLPPAATPQQIRDTAESWLRDTALRTFSALVQGRGCRIVLAYGKRGDWARRDGQVLRCHWRLIEQPPAVIAQVLDRALAEPPPTAACQDMFALA